MKTLIAMSKSALYTITKCTLILILLLDISQTVSSYNPESDGVTNEDVGFDDDVEVELTIGPLRLAVAMTTPVFLEEAEALRVMEEVKKLMSEDLAGRANAGDFQYLELMDLEDFWFDTDGKGMGGRGGSNRRSLSGAGAGAVARNSHNDNDYRKLTGFSREEVWPSTILQISGIKVHFLNNPPDEKNVMEWLKASINEHDFPAGMSRTNLLRARDNVLNEIKGITLLWKNEFTSKPTASPTPAPNPSPTVTVGVGVITPDPGPESKGSTLHFAIGTMAGGLVLVVVSFLLVRRHRRQNDGSIIRSNMNEFGGLDYIYDLGSKMGGFPVFNDADHHAHAELFANAPKSPEEIETIAVPVGKADSDVSSLSAGDDRGGVALAYAHAAGLKPFPLTNLTRVQGGLYNETNEGFERLDLDTDDGWVSEKGGVRSLPRLLSNPPGSDRSRLQSASSLRYSDTSSVSLETEHCYPDSSRESKGDTDLGDDESQRLAMNAQHVPMPSIQNRSTQAGRKTQERQSMSTSEYDLNVLEYDDRSSIGDILPSVV